MPTINYSAIRWESLLRSTWSSRTRRQHWHWENPFTAFLTGRALSVWLSKRISPGCQFLFNSFLVPGKMSEPAARNILADTRIPVLYTFAISCIFRGAPAIACQQLPAWSPQSMNGESASFANIQDGCWSVGPATNRERSVKCDIQCDFPAGYSEMSHPDYRKKEEDERKNGKGP